MFRTGRVQHCFALFAWAVLALNIPVILWGAYVRASFSGDGCGAHWPFCNGQVIPSHMAAPMAIEFTHRAMTGADTFVVVVLCVWAFLSFPRAHATRLYASLSLLFLFIEALLGAGLVLFRLVAHNHSAWRAAYLSGHLTNTMLLLAALTTTAWVATWRIDGVHWKRTPRLLAGALVIVLAVSVTGAIAALGDTLFPAGTLSGAVGQDFSSKATLLLRLRMVHPAIAVLGAVYLLFVAGKIFQNTNDVRLRIASSSTLAVTVLQLLAGVVNFALLAPLWMQLLHLLIADLLWISVIVLTLDATVSTKTRRDSAQTRSGARLAPIDAG
jgi:cytochrome c oxidase assembly protein subunit 15